MSEQTRTYDVAGMTCEHCRLSVAEEVGELDGVSGVEVDLAGGLVEVRGASLEDHEIAAAVEAAGYEVVAR